MIIDGQGAGVEYTVAQTDTLTILTRSVLEDSLPANELPYSMIGIMTDPLLGKTSASLYASLLIYEPSSDFPNTLEPDSAVLFIPTIDGLNFYGDRNTKQSWKIFPLKTAINGSAVYYQGAPPEVDRSIFTSYYGTIYRNKYDSVNYKNSKIELRPGIRIKLSAEMAKMLMQMPKSAYQSDAGLESAFKGIAIEPQDVDLPAGKGGIGIFGPSSTLTSLSTRGHVMLYYSDSQTFTFTFAAKNKLITSGKTGPYPANAREQIQNPDKSYLITYVQGLSGLKTYIQYPYLLDLLGQGNVAINKAEIVFSVEKSDNSLDFFAPIRLNLFQPAYKNSRRNYLLTDSKGGITGFGGIYNETAGTYTFNITQHVQEIVSAWHLNGNNINNGLYLTVPTAEPVLPARASINHAKTRLKITYTKLN